MIYIADRKGRKNYHVNLCVMRKDPSFPVIENKNKTKNMISDRIIFQSNY